MTSSPSPVFAADSPYRRLARALDALPNRFPPAADESDLRLLAKIFTTEEADLAARLLPELETPAQIAARLERPSGPLIALLKQMAGRGLIAMGKTSQGRLGFGLLPFVVGIYEAQLSRLDAEMARLFEDYFQQAFAGALRAQPPVHRVVPIGVSIQNEIEVRPYESASRLVEQAQAWGVQDCICRRQKALIGQPCDHPVEVCMVLSYQPGAFDGSSVFRPLTREQARQTLRAAAEAGLVHSVSNNQRDLWYICNCCTCSCGVLRGMAELGIANVVARSAFVNQVDEALCAGCEACLQFCSFGALRMDGTVRVDQARCAGCGVCVLACPQGALALVRREGETEPPETEADWRMARAAR